MYVRNHIAWRYKYEERYEERADVKQEHEKPVDFHGYSVDVICCRVELEYACCLLQEQQCQGDDVADDESLADDECCKPQEYVAYGVVTCSQCLKNAIALTRCGLRCYVSDLA